MARLAPYTIIQNHNAHHVQVNLASPKKSTGGNRILLPPIILLRLLFDLRWFEKTRLIIRFHTKSEGFRCVGCCSCLRLESFP